MKRTITLLCSLALGAALVPAASAEPLDSIVNPDPEDWTPHILDGKVRSTATVDGITVAGGDFTEVREAGSAGTLARTDIVAFDGSGAILDQFDPAIDGSEVFDVIPAGDGSSVFVAGAFQSVDGKPGTGRVARIDVHTGQVVETFTAPPMNNKATTLALVGGTLYVAGWFTRVGGQPQSLLVALDPASGDLRDTVDLAFTDPLAPDAPNGQVLRIDDMSPVPDGSALVVMGNFTRVDGQYRPQVAVVDLGPGGASVSAWAAEGFGEPCRKNDALYAWGVDVDPTGTYVVVGTSGAYSGGLGAGTLCDTVSRWELDGGADQRPTWVAYTGGDTVTDVHATGAAIYAGGHFRWFNNPRGNNVAGPGAVRRMGLAALDTRNGLPLRWNPGRQRGWGVWGFSSNALGLWVGHDTDVVGGEQHPRLALMPTRSFTGMLPPDDTGSLPGEVVQLGAFRNGRYRHRVIERSFTGSTVTDTHGIPRQGVRWKQARGAVMIDQHLYAGWRNGRLMRYFFDQDAFGPGEVVDLHGDGFANELPKVSALWFDAETGRLYYTLQRKARIFYRAFTPQSDTVGAVRHSIPSGPVGAKNTKGAFLADEVLYFVNGRGVLKRAQWDHGPVPGTRSRVSGPPVDGVDWRARGVFIDTSG